MLLLTKKKNNFVLLVLYVLCDIKVGLSLSEKICVVCFIESPLKMMNNFKIHDVTTWLTNSWDRHIAQISRSKSNQTMKLGQLIEYNKRNVFLQKLCNYAENKTRRLVPDLLLFFKYA